MPSLVDASSPGIPSTLLAAVCLSIVLVPSVRGQAPSSAPPSDDYERVLLVTTDGDSLRGRVEWASRYRTPEVVRFWRASADSVRTFDPPAVRAVSFGDGRRLVGRVAQLDQVPPEPKQAAAFLDGDADKIDEEAVLLEVLIDGALSFYRVQGITNRYFIEDEGAIKELIRRRYYVESRDVVNTVRAFRSQLGRRMEACPAVARDAATAEWEPTDFQELIVRYNRCVGTPPTVVEAPRPWIDVSFGIVGSGLRSHLALGFPMTSLLSIGWGPGVALGGSMTVQFPRTGRQWALRAELLRVIQRISANPRGFYLGTSLSAANSVQLDWVKLRVLVRHRIWKVRNRPVYVEGGATFGYLLSFDSNFPRTSYLFAGDRPEGELALGGIAGIGCRYGPIRVATHAELTTATGSYTGGRRSRLLNVHLSVGYVF